MVKIKIGFSYFETSENFFCWNFSIEDHYFTQDLPWGFLDYVHNKKMLFYIFVHFRPQNVSRLDHKKKEWIVAMTCSFGFLSFSKSQNPFPWPLSFTWFSPAVNVCLGFMNDTIDHKRKEKEGIFLKKSASLYVGRNQSLFFFFLASKIEGLVSKSSLFRKKIALNT